MKKIMNKKVNMFGKTVPVFVLVLLGMGVVAAALIPFFGIITGNAVVTQGLLVDGYDYTYGPITEQWDGTGFTSLESKTFVGVHYLDNDATVDAKVNLVGTCLVGTTASACDANQPATNYYETNLRAGTLELDDKNPTTWARIPDYMSATVDYTYDGSTFDYTLDATGLQINTQYVLIYYADKQNRFVNWGGDNPGALLGTFTTDTEGAIITEAGTALVTLPDSNDWNAGTEANYCNVTGDNYAHCRGAKIWLVPLSSYNINDKKLIGWNPNLYLFETDLLGWNHLTGELVNPFDVTSNTELDFVIVNYFPQMLVPDTYTITTTVGTVA